MNALATYLNDHLAGSVAAIELLDHLIKDQTNQRLEKFLVDLRDDIERDQEILRDLIQKLDVGESPLRKAGAWLAEKFSRAKIQASGEKVGELGLVQAFEMLVLGITGKQLLWRSLSVTMGNSPLLNEIDLQQLEERAIEQIERVEAKRLEAAREAFV